MTGRYAPWTLALLVVLANPAAAESAHAAGATRLHVFAAASLADAFKDLGRMLERRRPGLDVRFNFAGSQILAAQIEQGASADVFASADHRWMDSLKARGLIGQDPQVFAANRLVAIVPRSNPARLRSLEDFARVGVKVVIGAESVPVGAYTREVLAKLSRRSGFPTDYGRRVLANVVSHEENVRSVVGKIQLAEADAGFVYRSDVNKAAARHLRVIEIPAEANVTARYPIAVLRHAAASEHARAFVDLAVSAEGQAVLARHGFLAATDGTR